VTNRKSKISKSAAAPKAPLRVVTAGDALRKRSKGAGQAHDLCHLDSERTSKLRKRPTRF
jgi:hypothetical protein